jgi:hypothetical protein
MGTTVYKFRRSFKLVQQDHPSLIDYMWLLVLAVLEKHLLMEQKRRVQGL